MSHLENINFQDIYVVETYEEAEQFRYESTGETVEIGTPVAWDQEHYSIFSESMINRRESDMVPDMVMTCFNGIYFQADE